MRICAISDTHTLHRRLTIPECDVLIHCGDFTFLGKQEEVSDFRDWLVEQPADRIIVIAGNHEITFDPGMDEFDPGIKSIITKEPKITYLENSSVTIDGIKFWGTPWTPRFFDWGFNGVEGDDAIFVTYRDDSERFRPLDEVFAEIDDDVNVVISHGPVNGMVDRNSEDGRCGSVAMARRMQDLPGLKLSLCGHIHEARGIGTALNDVMFCNVSSVWRDYETMAPPAVIDLDDSGNPTIIEGYE